MSEPRTVECPVCGESMSKHWLYWRPLYCEGEIAQEAGQ